jgi:predicted outer membrane repeat protein
MSSGGEPIPASQGGAIYIGSDFDIEGEPSTLNASVVNSEFNQNSAQGDGGAIYFLGLLQLLGSRFEDNWALPGVAGFMQPQGSGGAVYAEKIKITASTFDSNFAAVDGGAVYVVESLEIFEGVPKPGKTHSTEFEKNVALGNGFDSFEEDEGQGGGGAIAAAGSITVADSSFKENLTFGNGSAINYIQGNLFDGTLTIKNSTFDANTAFGSGGAIYSLGDLSISGSTFGVMPEENPDYNPAREFLNPSYDSTSFEPRIILSPQCMDANAIYSGGDVCYLNEVEFNLHIENPAYQPEYFYYLDDDTKDEDNDKYNYGGNFSGNGGGAIYVEGATRIKDSTFS